MFVLPWKKVPSRERENSPLLTKLLSPIIVGVSLNLSTTAKPLQTLLIRPKLRSHGCLHLKEAMTIA